MRETIEPYSPVIPKLFQRASQPPNTILTYFTALKEDIDNDQKFDMMKPPPTPKNMHVNVKPDEEDDDIICILELTPPNKKIKKAATVVSTKKTTPNTNVILKKTSAGVIADNTAPNMAVLTESTTPTTGIVTRSHKKRLEIN